VPTVAVVLPARHVREREFHAHAIPVRAELFAKNLRQRGGDALPAFVLDDLEQHVARRREHQEIAELDGNIRDPRDLRRRTDTAQAQTQPAARQ
jgi:hypothetical protein